MELRQTKLENMVIFNNNFFNTFQNKKVFLTGHTGFKGSWFLALLNILGCQVNGYALAPKNEFDLYNLIDGNSLCNSIISDINNITKLKESIIKFQPDFIFHFAAQPLVIDSYLDPLYTFNTNVIGTANLLDCVRFLDKKCNVVIITTDKVYKDQEWDSPYKEDDILGGYDPYSSSKACSELVVDSYRNSFFNSKKFNINHKIGIGVGRAGNVIGGGDWSANRLIPDIIRAFQDNDKIIVRNPKAVRPWQHVLDPLLGYLKLAESISLNPTKFSEEFNFGPQNNDVLNVIDIIKKSHEYLKKGKYIIESNDNDFKETKLLKLDITKAQEKLGWKPLFNSDKSIIATLDWYKKYLNKENMKLETFKFIEKIIK